MREKLFEIIDGVQKYCSHEGTYCCDCEYSTYDSDSCWKYKVADAIIKSDLIKEERPTFICPKCGGRVEVLSAQCMGRDMLCVDCLDLYYYEDEALRSNNNA